MKKKPKRLRLQRRHLDQNPFSGIKWQPPTRAIPWRLSRHETGCELQDSGPIECGLGIMHHIETAPRNIRMFTFDPGATISAISDYLEVVRAKRRAEFYSNIFK